MYSLKLLFKADNIFREYLTATIPYVWDIYCKQGDSLIYINKKNLYQ